VEVNMADEKPCVGAVRAANRILLRLQAFNAEANTLETVGASATAKQMRALDGNCVRVMNLRDDVARIIELATGLPDLLTAIHQIVDGKDPVMARRHGASYFVTADHPYAALAARKKTEGRPA
jgi:hypothetical protein